MDSGPVLVIVEREISCTVPARHVGEAQVSRHMRAILCVHDVGPDGTAVSHGAPPRQMLDGEERCAGPQRLWLRAPHPSAPSTVLASCKSAVSKPSVNQP